MNEEDIVKEDSHKCYVWPKNLRENQHNCAFFTSFPFYKKTEYEDGTIKCSKCKNTCYAPLNSISSESTRYSSCPIYYSKCRQAPISYTQGPI